MLSPRVRAPQARGSINETQYRSLAARHRRHGYVPQPCFTGHYASVFSLDWLKNPMGRGRRDGFWRGVLIVDCIG